MRAFLARRYRPYLAGFVRAAHNRWSNTPFRLSPLTHVAQTSAARRVTVVKGGSHTSKYSKNKQGNTE